MFLRVVSNFRLDPVEDEALGEVNKERLNRMRPVEGPRVDGMSSNLCSGIVDPDVDESCKPDDLAILSQEVLLVDPQVTCAADDWEDMVSRVKENEIVSILSVRNVFKSDLGKQDPEGWGNDDV